MFVGSCQHITRHLRRGNVNKLYGMFVWESCQHIIRHVCGSHVNTLHAIFVWVMSTHYTISSLGSCQQIIRHVCGGHVNTLYGIYWGSCQHIIQHVFRGHVNTLYGMFLGVMSTHYTACFIRHVCGGHVNTLYGIFVGIMSTHSHAFLWQRHDLEMLSALLSFVKRIRWLPVTFPHKGKIMRIFGVSYLVSLYKLLNKHFGDRVLSHGAHMTALSCILLQ